MREIPPAADSDAIPAECTASQAGSVAGAGMAADAGSSEPRASDRVWRTATLFVVPYVVLMLAWAFSNPPGAAPDEPGHLVKAIGMARLDIGKKYAGTPEGKPGIGQQRNASLSRVITVPANLAPDGYVCEVFRPTATAACLPTHTSSSTAPKDVIVPLGSYPPFLYVPIGWFAVLASTPTQAFLLARVFCALASSLLLLLGAAHLVRALGRRALLGAFVGLTPMVVFCGSAVTTSGFEISAAFATSCVVVAGVRRPATLTQPGTQILLAVVGGTLILSRQLGVVTFGLMMVLLVLRIGPGFFWRLATAKRGAFLSSVAVLVVAGIAIALWERAYDHPSMIGSAFSAQALGSFGLQSYGILRSGVAQFGWLDTLIPPWFLAGWVVLAVMLIGTAALVGRRADRLTLLLGSLILLAVGFFTYATVFYPVGAVLQGRHLLAMFMLLPLIAGVMIVEQLDAGNPKIVSRMFRLCAIIMPVLHAVSLYLNARRYAVGSQGPVVFFGASRWQPPLGWSPWLVLGLIGAGALGGSILSSGRSRPGLSDGEGTTLVER